MLLGILDRRAYTRPTYRVRALRYFNCSHGFEWTDDLHVTSVGERSVSMDLSPVEVRGEMDSCTWTCCCALVVTHVPKYYPVGLIVEPKTLPRAQSLTKFVSPSQTLKYSACDG